MGKVFESVDEFANLCINLQDKNQSPTVAVGGFKGIGKSTFSIKLYKAFCKQRGIPFGFDRLTWSRQKLLTWIDGDVKADPDPATGLRPGQLPKKSFIIADELFKMFYKRQWYASDQKDALAVLNTCRDRNLLMIGCNPNFFALDRDFRDTIMFYVFIPEQGLAVVFEQEGNAFTTDQWNADENKKILRKYKKDASKSPNYICQFHFSDLPESEKVEYEALRNQKRIEEMNELGKVKPEKNAKRIKQRDDAIFAFKKHNPELSGVEIAKLIGMDERTVQEILQKAAQNAN
jgi:hypothetical protein